MGLKQIFRVLVVALSVQLALGGVALAQEDPSSERDRRIEILRVDEGLESGTVELIVALPASIGEIAPTVENFGLIEGRSRRAFTVSPIDEVVDVVVVVDTSGSMQGAPIDAARNAASTFIESLPDEARTAVIGFGASPQVLTTFEQGRSASISSVNGLRTRGETALWDALIEASEVAKASGASAPYIVLLSDGGDTASVATQAQANGALKSANAALYAITLETPESDHSALNETAASIGGTVLATGEIGSLDQLFDEVGNRLNHRYRISFRSDRTDSRPVRVSVAIDGAIATAQVTIGNGLSEPVTNSDPVPTRLGDTIGPGAGLGTLTGAEPGLLGGSSSLWLGAFAFFIVGLLLMFLITDPLGTRVQSLGSLRVPDATQRVSGVSQKLTDVADRAIARGDEEGGLDRTLDAAGLNIRPGEFVVLALATVLGLSLMTQIFLGTFAALVAAVLSSVGSVLGLNMKVSRRRKAFAEQLHSTITILVGSMRAGRGLPQAIELAAQESASPTAEELRRVVIESRVGRDTVASLEATSIRMKNEDLHWIAQAIGINKELGGDLTELLDNLASVIRDRGRVKLQVQSLSAEGRMSAWVVGVLPIALFVYMHVVNRPYVKLLYTTFLGTAMLVGGIALMIGGAIWMKKLVNVKY